MPSILFCLTCLSLGGFISMQDLPTPAEASEWKRTTTLAQAQEFLGALEARDAGARLQVGVAGTSGENRPILLVAAGKGATLDAAQARSREGLRILVVGNIHAGEVEGKESLLILLREIVGGDHDELLDGLQFWCLPIYNVDGNEAIKRSNRVSQNGPEEGVGQRPNAAGLDLNRDFVKAEASETRALLKLFNEYDPHLVLDLHTTNGSYHGYHLTYATSLSPNTDPRLDRFARNLILEETRQDLQENHGIFTFDYGNLSQRTPLTWSTYDHRPRFGTNMLGLRNRLSVLSEAYSYLEYPKRVEVTREFVLGIVRRAKIHGEALMQLEASLDQEASKGKPFSLGLDTALVADTPGTILLGAVDEVPIEGLGVRRVDRDEHVPTLVGLRLSFEPGRYSVHPRAWAIEKPEPGDQEVLKRHGIQFRILDAPVSCTSRRFQIAEAQRAKRLFQAHYELTLVGEWEGGPTELPAGTLLVSSAQPLTRVAAQLLSPQSEDSLWTWGHFDGRLDQNGSQACVLRVETLVD